jgi:hypothetical protein
MGEAYITKDRRMIDPYFNDVVGLYRTFEYIKKSKHHSGGLVGELGGPENYFHNCS